MEAGNSLLAVLHYRPYDVLPLACLGFEADTIAKWTREGYLPIGSPAEKIYRQLGFDWDLTPICCEQELPAACGRLSVRFSPNAGDKDAPFVLCVCGLYAHLLNHSPAGGRKEMEERLSTVIRSLRDQISGICDERVPAVLVFEENPAAAALPADMLQILRCFYRELSGPLREMGIEFLSLSGMDWETLEPLLEEGYLNLLYPLSGSGGIEKLELWRLRFGRRTSYIGGMDPHAFSGSREDVDREIGRMYRLTEQGGILPCPDAPLPSDALWDNVLYYTDRMRTLFS